MRLVFENWLLGRGWLFALPVAAMVALAGKTGDLRLWVVVPVLTCMFIPLIVAFVYYSYSLTPEAVAAIRPHRVALGADGSLTLTPEPDPETGRQLPALRLPADEIAQVEERPRRFIVHIKSKPFRYIIIPNIQPDKLKQ